jgi:hypothetical protein
VRSRCCSIRPASSLACLSEALEDYAFGVKIYPYRTSCRGYIPRLIGPALIHYPSSLSIKSTAVEGTSSPKLLLVDHVDVLLKLVGRSPIHRQGKWKNARESS